LGFEVVTIDLGVGPEPVDSNALHYDLCKPVEDIGKFDFIIDFGTGEHIGNQYELFRNIHNLCKVNGIILRCNPSIRFAKKHGKYYYTFVFYQKFSQVYNYEIIDVRECSAKYLTSMKMPWKHCLFAALRKTQDSNFSQDEWDSVAAGIENGSRRNTAVLISSEIFR